MGQGHEVRPSRKYHHCIGLPSIDGASFSPVFTSTLMDLLW